MGFPPPSPSVNFSDCRVSDFYVWDPKNQAFGECFFRVCLQLPIFGILAISSAYYTGRRTVNYILFTTWNTYQATIIYIRAFVISLLAILPLVGLMVNLGAYGGTLGFTEIILIVVKSLTWLIHLCYTLQLKRGISYNCRGPKPIIFFWIITALVSAMDFRRLYFESYFQHSGPAAFWVQTSVEDKRVILLQLCASGAEAFFQFAYLLTLIPGSIHLDTGQYRSLLTDSPTEPHTIINQTSNFYIGFLEDEGPIFLGVAKENAGPLSKLLFWWVNRLMRKGSCGYLTHSEDLFDLPPKISTSLITTKFQEHLVKSDRNLIRSLWSCFGFEFLSIGVLKLISDASGFCGPILLNLLINFIEEGNENDAPNDVGPGYLYVFGMLAAALIGSLCSIHFDMNMAEVNLKIRAAIVSAIYRKTLFLRKASLENFNAGEIINFLSTDTNRITNFCPSLHAFWSLPLQIAIALYLLYTQIGLAFLAGIVFAILLIPVNKVIANKIGVLSAKMMHHKDQRVKIMSEILQGICNVKFHSWETFFAQRVNESRKLELSALKGRKYLDALCVYFWATTPVLVSILSFGTFILFGNELTAAKVFTSLALFNMLIGPLNALPWVINGIIEAWVSIRRVSKLLQVEETEPCEVYSPIPPNQNEHVEFSVADGIFEVGASETGSFTLGGINLNVKTGQLIGIVGEVGAGKSSLLLSLLGELKSTSGTLGMRDAETGFGVVFQDPWIQRGSIRRNILFGKPYNATTYNEVIKACCLLQDFEDLEDGDDTLCSSNTLSGGQKLRITLARAVYQDKPIYLLDDIFSCVDANVAKQLYKSCLMGILKNKTRILVTHHVKFLRSADIILVLDNGRIINQGTPEEILPIFFDEDMTDDLLSSSTPKDSVASLRLRSLESKSLTGSIHSDEMYTCDSLTRSVDFINKPENPLIGSDPNEETKCEGAISWIVYKTYWDAIGQRISFGILLFLFLMQATKNLSDLWLAHWVSASNNNSTPVTPTPIPPTTPAYYHNSRNSTMDIDVENSFHRFLVKIGNQIPLLDGLGSDVKYYFIIFILIGVANSFCALGRAFLFAYGAIEGGRRIHMRLLRVILKAKMTFFNKTPIGRIINRFSSDVTTVDDSLPFTLNILLAQLYGLLGTLILTSYALPWILLIILPLLLVVNNLQNYYRHTARQCRRISSVSLSPIYAHFSETIRGIITIRAMRSSRRFEHENEVYLENSQRAMYSTQAVSQWLSFRLQMVGVLVITGVGIIGVMQHGLGIADPGIIGLAISYALTITASLSGFVTSFTETEKEMVAVERLYEYTTEVEVESRSKSSTALPYLWPSQGVVAFIDVSLRYRDGNSYALRKINFETGPCEKIGIVGRTGSGKSSLFQALFRIVDSYEGEITIDSVNIQQTSLKDLRGKIGIVPQDPLIFSGTLRENLNPKGDFSDDSITRVVQKCHLTGLVRQLGGLGGDVGEGGSFLSAGQKQLVQLARAMLTNPKILCIDEATANIDHETDKVIQATIRSSFRTSTVLTVSHRVTSVLHSHRVIVMKNGSIVEIDAPEKLMLDKSSYFYQLAQGNV